MFSALVRRYTLPLLLAALLIPFAWWSNWHARPAYEQVGAYFQVITGVVVVACLAASWRFVQVKLNPLHGFAIYGLVSIVWSIRIEHTFVAAFGLLIYILTFTALLRSYEYERGVALGSWVVVIGLISLALLNGLNQRTIGSVNANMIGVFAMIVCIHRAIAGRLTIWWIIAAYGLLAYTQSRTDIIALTTFLIVRYIFLWFDERQKSIAPPAIAILFAIPLVFALQTTILRGLLSASTFIGITETRRLDDSLTGRTQYWEAGWRQFMDDPFFGHGYYTRANTDITLGDAVSAHSGMINLLLDVGIFGAAIFVTAFMIALLRTGAGVPGWRRKSSISCCAALIGYIPRLFVEPGYIGLYDPGSITLVFCLCFPYATRRPLRGYYRNRSKGAHERQLAAVPMPMPDSRPPTIAPPTTATPGSSRNPRFPQTGSAVEFRRR